MSTSTYIRAAVVSGVVTVADTGAVVPGANITIAGNAWTTNSAGELLVWAPADTSGNVDATLAFASAIAGHAQPSPVHVTGAAGQSIVLDGAGLAFTPSQLLDTSDLHGGVPVVQTTLTGSVTYPDGSPIAGVTVTATNSAGWTVAAVTDLSGAFSLGVTYGSWTITAQTLTNLSAPSVDVPDSSSAGPLVLAYSGWAAYVGGVTRTPDGTPVSGVNVSNGFETVTSEADGSFYIGGAASIWTLSGADVAGYLPAVLESGDTHSVSVDPTLTTQQDLIYTPLTRSVSGRVVDDIGNPVEGAPVQVQYWTADDQYATASVVTEWDGTYSVGVPTNLEEVDVYVGAPQGYTTNTYGSLHANVQLQYPDDNSNLTAADVTLMRLGISMFGFVTDDSGTPIEGAIVVARWNGANGINQTVVTGADGRWSLLLSQSSWRIGVFDDANLDTGTLGGYSTPQGQSLNPAPPTTGPLDFVYRRAAIVTGTATLSDTGGAAAGVGLEFDSNDGTYVNLQTDTTGSFVVWNYPDSSGTFSGSLFFTSGVGGYARPAEIDRIGGTPGATSPSTRACSSSRPTRSPSSASSSTRSVTLSPAKRCTCSATAATRST